MTYRKIGLVIGINEYLDPKLPNLLFAKKDAEDMRAVLLNPDIGGFKEIVPLVNETKINVTKAIEKLLLKDASVVDLVLIYFSGHGKLNTRFELNLLLKDTENDYLSSTALPYNFIKDCIEETKCKKIILILDCCHSGAAVLKGDISKTISETSGSGTFILTATTGSNRAKEVEELENGVFTHFILEGLKKGDADLGKDGLIDILELYEFASKKCNDEYKQVTTIKSKFEDIIVIGKNPLIFRENEYASKKKQLLDKYIKYDLPVPILDISQSVLRNYYEGQSSLDPVEKKIYDLLNSFLIEDLCHKNYVEDIQLLKGICITEKKNKTIIAEDYQKREMKELSKQKEGERKQREEPERKKQEETEKLEAERKQKEEQERIQKEEEEGKQKEEEERLEAEKKLTEEQERIKFGTPNIRNTFTHPFTGMEFVLIPAGKFIMGSSEEGQGRDNFEGPIHKVTIGEPFFLSKYPVTAKQWECVMGIKPPYINDGDCPIGVAWDHAQEFITKLNEMDKTDKYRLPSEAEWEYSCRAGTTTIYSFGNDESKLDEYAWYGFWKNLFFLPHPVGLKKPNPWGLYDMHGNIMEWCQDTWHNNYDGAPDDGRSWEDGSSSRRVFRGGKYNSSASGCRSAKRDKGKSDSTYVYIGFRVVREI